MNVLEINRLTKLFNRVAALDNVSFTVPEGCVAGLVGPNGNALVAVANEINGSTVIFEGTNDGGVAGSSSDKPLQSQSRTP